MSKQQARRLVDDVTPLCCEYYGMRVEAPDQECPSSDEGVCGVRAAPPHSRPLTSGCRFALNMAPARTRRYYTADR